ncbi:MAG: peptidoglycan recognition family protein [Elusimicrobiota bacterium]
MRALICVFFTAASVSAVFAQDTGTPVAFGGRYSGAYRVAAFPAANSVVLRSGTSDPIPIAYDTVLLQGILPDPGVTLEFSRQDGTGRWSAWRRVELKRRGSGRFWAKLRFPTVSTGKLRFRAVANGSGAAHKIQMFTIEVFTAGPRPPAGIRHGKTEQPVPPGPEIIGRAAWNAQPPKDEPVEQAPVRLTQHHTAGRQPFSLAESIEEVRFIQDFHQNGRGWSDIGYHFLLDGEGRIFEGRPKNVQGAHVRGANEGNIGIALLGFYHPPYDNPVTPQQRATLKALGRWLVGVYDIAPETYRGHRDLGKTDCPGDVLYSQLEAIRASFSAPSSSSAVSGFTAAPTIKGSEGAGGELFDGSVAGNRGK